MIRAATQTEINEAFAAQRKSLGRVMTHEEIRALDAILARPIERGSTPRFDDAFVAAYACEHHLIIRDLALDLKDARAELNASRKPCEWTQIDSREFEVGCKPGETWMVPAGLEAHEFCPHCGHPCTIKESA